MPVKLQRAARPHEISGAKMTLVRNHSRYAIVDGWVNETDKHVQGIRLAYFRACGTEHAKLVLAEMGFSDAVRAMFEGADVCSWCGAVDAGTSDGYGEGYQRCNACGGN